MKLDNAQKQFLELVIKQETYSKGVVTLSTVVGDFKVKMSFALKRQDALEKAHNEFFKLERKFDIIGIIPKHYQSTYLGLLD